MHLPAKPPARIALRSADGRTARRRARRTALLVFLAAGLLAPSAHGEEYRLGPQDKIRIRVLEWLPARGAYQAWDALDGEYAVSGEGSVSIPLVGSIPAAGMGSEALARAIGETVREKTGLQTPPVVSVEVSQFRPFYVIGAVKTPGEYAWRPGLDVIKAVGLAGGRYRPFEGSPRLERDVITQTGVVRSIELEIVRTLARRARIEAEQAGRAEIEVPREVGENAAGALIMAEESAILASRRESLARQVAAIDELKALLQTEIGSLQAKAEVLERQLVSARTELSNVTELASRGLSPANRQFSMDRVLGDLQAQQLDLSTAVVRARQSIANAERDKIALVEDRRLQLAREQQDTQAALEQLEARRHTAERLIYEASTLAPKEVADALAQQEVDVAMAITRTADGRRTRFTASRDTPVLPGDVVELFEPAAPERAFDGTDVSMSVSPQAGEPLVEPLQAAAPLAVPQVPVPTSADALRPGEG